MKSVRPRSVTVLAILVLTIGGINLLRVIESLRQWDFIKEIMFISPVYLTLSGLMWAVTGFILVWGLLRGERWAPKSLKFLSIFFVAYTWFDRLLLVNPNSKLPNNLFLAIVSLLLLGFIFWILSRKNVKAFFGENYE